MNIGFLYAIGAAVTWGLVYTIDQKVLHLTSPGTLLFIDSLVTACIMLPFLFVDHGSVRSFLSSGKENLWFALLSIFLAALANFFIFSAIKSLGASSASIIEIAYPFFVVLFGLIFFRAVPSMAVLIGGGFILAGSAIITYFYK